MFIRCQSLRGLSGRLIGSGIRVGGFRVRAIPFQNGLGEKGMIHFFSGGGGGGESGSYSSWLRLQGIYDLGLKMGT